MEGDFNRRPGFVCFNSFFDYESSDFVKSSILMSQNIGNLMPKIVLKRVKRTLQPVLICNRSAIDLEYVEYSFQ